MLGFLLQTNLPITHQTLIRSFMLTYFVSIAHLMVAVGGHWNSSFKVVVSIFHFAIQAFLDAWTWYQIINAPVLPKLLLFSVLLRKSFLLDPVRFFGALQCHLSAANLLTYLHLTRINFAELLKKQSNSSFIYC